MAFISTVKFWGKTKEGSEYKDKNGNAYAKSMSTKEDLTIPKGSTLFLFPNKPEKDTDASYSISISTGKKDEEKK